MGRLLLLLGYIITPVGALCRTASFKALAALAIVVFSASTEGFSQNPFRTRQSGPWNDPNTWEEDAGGGFAVTSNTPDFNSGTITIRSPHVVTVTADVTIDESTVNSGGSIVINSGITLYLNEDFSGGTILGISSGATLTNNGTFDLNGLIFSPCMVDGNIINTGSILTPVADVLSFNSGSTYFHQFITGGNIPIAHWDPASVCEINSLTQSSPASPVNLDQDFGTLRWNCPSMGSTSTFAWAAMPTSIGGNLEFITTNGKSMRMKSATAPGYSLTIEGDVINQGVAVILGQNLTSATSIVIKGNFTQSKPGSTIPSFTYGVTNSGDISLEVRGNFSSTAGTFNKGSGTFNASLSFAKVGNQSFSYTTTTFSGAFIYTIVNGSILDAGTSAFVGTGATFNLQGGATLKVGHANGLNTGTTAGNGNVLVSGTRTYAPNSNIIYNGGAAQILGTEWSSSGALNGVAVNLEIANSNGVTNNIVGSTSLVGILTLTSGSLNIGNSNTLQIQGIYNGNGGTIGGDPTSNLVFSVGSGAINGNLAFKTGAENLNNFTIARTGQTINLTTPLTVAGTLSFSSTSNLRFNGVTLTVNGDIVQSGSGGLTRTSGLSNLVIGGSGALSALPFVGAPQLNNVTLGRGSGSYTWGSAASVTGTLDLTAGSLTHSSGLTMASGSTFSRSASTSYTGVSPSISGLPASYNVAYTGTNTTGNELPASPGLNNLTISGNVTLAKTITINGDLNINSGTFDAALFNVTVAGPNFLINGGAFVINSAALVTFAASGSTTLGGSSLSGIQFGNLTINGGTTLVVSNAISPTINVSGTWDNNGSFTPNTSTIAFNGASQGIDPNGQPFNAVTFGGTGTKTLAGALVATGALTITSTSTLDVGSNNPINVAGSWNNSGTFNPNGGTVTFNGTSQSINSAGQSFYNLTLSNSGTKSLAANIDIDGILTIDPTVTFDVTSAPYSVTIGGNWINNGTFNRRTGLVTFDGTTTISGSGAANFSNVTITGSLTAPSATMDISGNWVQTSGSFIAGTSTLNFSGSTQSITPGGQAFNNLTIAGTNTKTLQGSAIINGALTFTSGTFNSNGNSMDLKGNLISNSTSTLTASAITFSGTTTISGSSVPTFGGITVTGILTPSASFNVNGNLINNGTLNASAGTVTFGGNTTISGSSTCTFSNVTINGTLVAPSGNVNVAGNWNNSGTFTASSGTVTFTGTTNFSGSSTTNFANIAISGTVNAPTTLNVAGNFANNGTFNRGTGTVVFNGSSTQSISGSTVTDFNNITVSNNVNSPAVQVQSNHNLRGVLTLSGTNTVFDADGSANTSIFRVMSTADNPTLDASIATLPTGTSVSGNVTVQRYMSIEGANSARIYRYIASPVTNAPVSQLQSFIPVTGAFTGASSCSGCGTSQSMFSYDETVTTDTNLSGTADLNDGYINFPAAANSEQFAPGRGYTVFVRGNIAPVSGAGSALWELRGPINAGNVSLPVSFTSSGNAPDDGWNLVGNPYPSTIDWNAAGWTKTNINNATYVLDNGLTTPVYATYIGGVGANGGSQYIAAGQAFFVKASGAPVLTATEAVKVAGTQTTYFRQSAVPDMVRVTLRQGTVADEAVIRFTSAATSVFDSQWDAHKLTNPGTFNLSSLTADNVKLAINSMPPLESCLATVKIDVSNVTPGSYKLDFSDYDSFTDVGTKLILVDSYTNQSIDVRANNSYPFEVTTNAASFGSSRFSLTVGESLKTITATDGTGCGKGSVTLTASGASDGNYRWYDSAVGGSPIDGAVNGTFSTPVINKTTTFYVAAANSAGCTSSQRIPVVATVTVIDPVVISVDGVSLKSSYSQGNQWYVDGVAIPGATSQFYTPLKSGVYKVAASSQNCTTSAEREFVVTGLEDTALPSHITVYPNPTEGNVSVAVKSANEVTARVLSLNGSLLQEKPLEGTTVKRGSFNLEDQAAGMYIMIIQDGNQTFRTRLIKNR